MEVRELLSDKGDKVVTTRPDTPISQAILLMKAERIGAVVVSSDGDHIDGILSERDIVGGLGEHGCDVLELTASDLMTRGVKTCSKGDHIKDVMSRMTRTRIRHLPVVERGKLCGLVSIGDVVKNRLEEMTMESNVLRDAYLARQV